MDLGAEVKRRIELKINARSDKARAVVLKFCSLDPVLFMNDWVWVYEPRNASLGLPTTVPFRLRPKQEELVRWLGVLS